MSQRLVTFLHNRHPDRESNALTAVQERMALFGRPLTPGEIDALASEIGLPVALLHGVATFYEDTHPKSVGQTRILCCQGTACLVDGARETGAALEEVLQISHRQVTSDGAFSLEQVYCLGRCHAAPSLMIQRGSSREVVDQVTPAELPALLQLSRAGEPVSQAQEVRVEAHSEPVILLRRMDRGASATDLATALAGGAYEGLRKALQLTNAQIIEEVQTSGLRGRGGAGFPTGQKWSFAAGYDADQKYVCCNADEGDPGSYIDKLLMERDPHGLLAGMAIAGLAIGATEGVIYLRSEYPEAIAILETAIAEATAAGLLGSDILGTGKTFHVRLFLGAGAYVCGEETAMLRSIEGLRGEVSVRPPFPAEKGLYGKPTVVNNVETLANIDWILAHGGAAYAAIGIGRSRGTKAVSLNSLFARPGLYEVPLGTSVRTIIEELGGGLRDGLSLKGVQIGGPMGGILPPEDLDAPLGFEELAAVGGLLGHGSIVAIDSRVNMIDLARHLFEFTADESCGKCVPCRIGSVRGVELLDRLPQAIGRSVAELQLLEDLLETMELGSLCALGGGVPAAIYSILRHWRHELLLPTAPDAATGTSEQRGPADS